MSIDVNSLSAKELECPDQQGQEAQDHAGQAQARAVVTQEADRARPRPRAIRSPNCSAPAAAADAAPRRRTRARSNKGRKPLGKVAPKYRNPANAAETWSGRGKQPRWLAAYTGAGRSLDEFLIK